MRDRSAAANFGIVIYQGVEPIYIGGTVGVISMARRMLPAIEAAVVAAEPGQVALAGGLSIIAQHALTFDQVIVCGGPGWPAAAEDASLLAFLRRQPATSIASVCTGALILAAAGVLDGRAATVARRLQAAHRFHDG